MGYHAQVTECIFGIPKTNFPKLERVLGKPITEALDELGYWDFDETLDGSINDLNYDQTSYDGDKMFKFFTKIAPYIELPKDVTPAVCKHPYVQFSGDENEIWRFVFVNGEVKEIVPKITWEYE